MTKPEFDAAVETLLVQFAGSLVSGRRTIKHSISVGGFDGDPHTWGMGNDVIWDTWPDIKVLEDAANRLGITVIREKNKPHDHFQPIGWVNKPHTPPEVA